MSKIVGPNLSLSGLVLWLDAANPRSYTSGSTSWYDMSGNGNTGTLVSGSGYSSSNNGSIVFDGVNDYVILTRPSQIVTSGSISISLWAKWTTVGTTISTIQALVDNNHNATPRQGFFIQDRPDLNKVLTFGVYPSAAGASSSFQVGDGTWKHITGTHSAGTSSLYINGRLDGFLIEPNMVTVQPFISLGYWQNGPGRYLTGSIASLQIYNRSLSADEVLQNYNALKSRFGL
jgi:hypothetical protein